MNHEIRIKLGLSMNEYAIADTIYHLSHSTKYKGNINKTYLADFFGITRQNISLIIKRLIEKGLINDEGNKTTEKWNDLIIMCNETLHKVEGNNTQYNNNNNNIYSKEYGEKSNDLSRTNKKEKEKTDLESVSVDELIEWRNELPNKYSFPSFRGKKGQTGYDNLENAWRVKKKQYTKEEFNKAMELYMVDIEGRNMKNSYATHRFSLYEWIKQGNGMVKFISLIK